MHEICRIDIGKGEEVYREIDAKLRDLSNILRQRYKIKRIIAFGSYVRRDLNEGSDIDIVIVGNFEGKQYKRIAQVLGLVDLPVEPLCYTEAEFEKMIKNENPFITTVLREGVDL